MPGIRSKPLAVVCALAAVVIGVALLRPSAALAFPSPYTLTQSGSELDPGTTDIGNHCDDCVTNVALPFSFSFWGVPYTTANVSSNGNLQFTTANTDYDNSCFPVDTFGPTIFAFWDDLDTHSAGPGSMRPATFAGPAGIYTSITGSAPNRVFNIEWRAFLVDSEIRVNFEIRLYEGSQRFEIVYGDMDGEDGSSATIGIQDDQGEDTQPFSCNTSSISPTMQLIYDYAPRVDVSVLKIGTPDHVSAGGNITYTIWVSTLIGLVPATDVVVSDTLPPGTTFVSLSTTVGSGWSSSTPSPGSGGTVTISNPSIGATDTSIFVLTVNVDPNTPPDTIISNTATVTTTATDSQPLNDFSPTATNTVIAGGADLAITKVSPIVFVAYGQPLPYAITVSNLGPSTAQNVTWTDTLPAGELFSSLSAPVGWTCTTPPVGSGGTVTCSIPSLATGTSATFVLTVVVFAPGVANTASVSSSTPDSNPLNNSSTAANPGYDSRRRTR